MDPEVVSDPAVHEADDRSVQGWLRTQTAGAHVAAEAAVMRALVPLSEARYGAYLRALLALYTPLEARLWSDRTLCELIPDAAARRKVPWLIDDLDELGLEVDASPRSTGMVLRDPLELLGAAYVLEGATLGGSVLLARLRSAGVFAQGGERGTRFLSGYGPQTAAMWRAFRANLQRAACAASDWSPLGHGALLTFGAFERALSRASGR